MGTNQHIVFIVSDNELRAQMIQNLIHRTLNTKYETRILNTGQFDQLEQSSDNNLLIIDLMSIDKSSGNVINMITANQPDSKILTLHIYRSSMLINPLFEMGINGYLYYEPTKEELASAINTVLNGRIYKPEFLLNT